MSTEPISDLAHARATFEQWRAQRPGPGRLPEHLWTLAESLVPRYSAQTVARELGLNASRLRARLERTHPRPRRRASKPAFVELRAVDLVPATSTPADRRLQPCDADAMVSARVERPDGLTIAFAAGRPRASRRCLRRLPEGLTP